MKGARRATAARLGLPSRATCAALAALAALSACGRERPAPPADTARYVVPPPWRGDRGVWFYPAARFGGTFSGLAVPMAPRLSGAPLTDGATFDPRVPAAAVQSLQLPVMLVVTNLLNGRRMTLRADTLGPPDPARALGLDAAAARALGVAGPTPVSVAIDTALSEQMASALGGMPHAVSTAPLASVSETPLGAPGGGVPPARGAAAGERGGGGSTAAAAAAPAPVVVSDAVTVVPVGAVSLFLDAGHFSGATAAGEVAARIGGVARPVGRGRFPVWLVTRGPFATVAAADDALDQAEAAGISGCRIVASDPAAGDGP